MTALDQRTSLIERAKIAEQTERYDDMSTTMKKVVEMGQPLNEEERNLFSCSFKNAISAKRSSWRVISSIESKRDHIYANEYKKTIEKEIVELCDLVLNLLNEHLLPKVTSSIESNIDNSKFDDLVKEKVFYLKMKGDYYRYLAEIQEAIGRPDAVKHSLAAYTNASSLGNNGVDGKGALLNWDPLKLGVALNFSVFYYELKGDVQRACEIGKTAFDEALANIDALPERMYKDATQIMQLIRDNLHTWTESEKEE